MSKITAEEFLYNTTEEEVFSILHEFVKNYEVLKGSTKVNITDRELAIIAEHMIHNIKDQAWL